MGYFQVSYDSRFVIYERKMFIRLATGLPPQEAGFLNGLLLHMKTDREDLKLELNLKKLKREKI